eukprot:scaffold44662_cov28-Tisochrysis_lutea.AAC.6
MLFWVLPPAISTATLFSVAFPFPMASILEVSIATPWHELCKPTASSESVSRGVETVERASNVSMDTREKEDVGATINRGCESGTALA